MTQSILNSTKKVLGIPEDQTEFDFDILMHINSTFATLLQLGIGPVYGFTINGASETWDDFLLGDRRLDVVKTYVYMKVRMIFDPPSMGHHVASMEKQIAEMEFRINLIHEADTHGTPPSGYSPGGGNLDGGSPFDSDYSPETVFDGGSP